MELYCFSKLPLAVEVSTVIPENASVGMEDTALVVALLSIIIGFH